MEAIPMCIETIRIKQYPSNTNYLLLLFRLATCFDLTGSSSGLHCEPKIYRKLRTFLGSQTMFTIGKRKRFMSSSYLW